MTDAVNMPVRRSGRELHSGDVPIDQAPVIEDREDLEGEVVIAPEQLQKEYAEALKFAEEPVTIRIERSSEKFAPSALDCWVNGKGAEILQNGRWVEMRYVPIGMPVTIKRKYVEVLLRSKIDSIRTKVEKYVDHERNLIERYTSSVAPLSVIRDANPKGPEWFERVIRSFL